MGLRCLVLLLVIETLLWSCEATSFRQRRQVSNNNFPNQPSETKVYQPPILLGASSSVPVASSATLQNSYQPPISLIRSNEYQSPLISPQNQYPANSPRTYQSPPVSGQSPQSYGLPNQPQSVQYIPPAIPSVNQQQSFSVFQQPPQNSVPQPATSYSVRQQSSPSNQGQSFAILSDNSGLPHSTAERTYSTHSKVVESHVPAQAIHKAPASEIQSDKGSSAKEKDNKNDEYVVYYYYYYDNDTNANNLSLNFDDIPSLEAYDNDKLGKEPEKSASARTLSANINSLAPVAAKPDKDTAHQTEGASSQPRSVGDVYGRPDRANNHPLDDTLVQPLKPVSNVFRYGSNEVPRFPVLPNFIVTEVPTTTKPEISTPDTLITEAPTTQPAVQPDLKTGDEADDDDFNNVLDSASDLKATEDKTAEEEQTTTTTTTTTEAPTTTEEPTTTTEKPRRRPSLGGGGRRRFNPSPSPSFSSSRGRQTPSRSSTTSTSSSTTTTTSAPTRRSFQGNRIRPRPSIGSNRPRSNFRSSTEASDDKDLESTTASTTTTTTSSRSRFTSSSPRRFQSSRSRSQSSSSTSTTTTTRSPSIASRSRPTSRPRPNPVARNRPARPGFLRPRPGSEPDEPETTTAPPAPTEKETSPEPLNDELPSTDNEDNETEEDNETSAEETEEPTTTEGSRFSALFRPRNRNTLGNRPRPVIGNRPSRS